jgi:pentatricopeptide repeat protein
MKMQEQGLLPDSTIFVTILRACGNAAKLESGKRIHAQTSVATELMESREYLEAATIDMYGKCGCMKYAHDIFNAMPLRGLVTWNTLLTCYARYGETDTVFHSLETMNQEGLLSDAITFLCVINACSHAGLVSRGQDYFKRLSGEFGINPSLKHYSCMIDLLGRAGRLDEASELFKVMPFARDRLAINSMLGACQKWEDVEVGSETFERVQQNVEMDHASFILMSNIFASGRLEV